MTQVREAQPRSSPLIRISNTDIIKDLTSVNICKRCCLRYLNERNPEAYKNAERYMKIIMKPDKRFEDYVPVVKQSKPNPCSACLGLLQLSEDDEFLDKITEEVKAAGFDSDDVTFALSLPITIMLRDYSVWLYISNKFSPFYGVSPSTAATKRTAKTVSVKEAWKYTAVHRLAEKLNKNVYSGIDGSFRVNINLEYDMDSEETSCLINMFPHIFKNRSFQRRKFHGEILTRKSVESVLPSVALEYFEGHYPVPPEVPSSFIRCGTIECMKDSLFLAGRYNKFSRNLSQTPWLIDGQRRLESSVEEMIGNPVAKVITHSGIKFSSSGREDVDVRTLGRGRPFILEVMNPRKTHLSAEDVRLIEKDINESSKEVCVRDLQVVSKQDLTHIKDGEQTKAKTYNCFCITKLMEGECLSDFEAKLTELNAMGEIALHQKTPVRVLHRRSHAVRSKNVFWLRGKLYEIKDDIVYFKLSLQVSAGTYIKEFVHGDFGRTQPNLAQILKREVDILALDVEEVDLDWPPSVQYSQKEYKTDNAAYPVLIHVPYDPRDHLGFSLLSNMKRIIFNLRLSIKFGN